MTILAWIVRQIGITGCIILGMLAYYEGFPYLREIPFVDRIPVVREMIVGKVATERAKAAASAIEGMVSRAELAASEAVAEKLQNEIDLANRKAEEATRQMADAERRASEASAELEARIEADTAADTLRWDQRSLDKLSKH